VKAERAQNRAVDRVDLQFDERRLAAVCRRYAIARLDVFGSVSRGATNEASDVDLLYELVPGSRLGWDIETLADELAEILGRDVDLVSRRAIHARLRERVLAEARPLYAA
jgi:predicted nucleotidyltransferase